MITDLKYLQQMTGNDSAMMKEMIELFLHQLTEMQADIELLVENKNWLELSRLAHKIKSSALVMGIEQMADDMKELELLAKESKNIEKYPDYIARFNTMTDLTEVELRAYLDSSGK
jgi:HPt (histidine-containing phosphotransfer) domain-containing protein